jgi:NADH-quinone oxidoreductase subunit N
MPGYRELVDQITKDLKWFTPEIVLTAFSMLVLLLDLKGKATASRARMLGLVTLLGLGLPLWLLWPHRAEARSLFGGMLALDGFGFFFKVLFLASTAISVILALMHRRMGEARLGEFFSILLASVVGMFLMASATDFVVLFLGLEILSLSSYVLTGYLKRDRASAEASMKYVIYGAVASGLMVYGLSLYYGLTGSTSLSAVTQIVALEVNTTTLTIASMLLASGFLFKMAVVPLHFWCPDVYQGAPTAVTAWLSVASKAAGFAVFLRLLHALDPRQPIRVGSIELAVNWMETLSLLAAVTMTLGNLAALFQRNVKRLLAYSSIAHAGYLMMGVAALGAPGLEGYRAVGFYLLVYLFMNLGAFAIVILLSNHLGSDEVDSYRGLGRRAPFLAGTFTLFLFALIGMPPTAGFAGKVQLFMAAIHADNYWLAVVGGVNTAISVYYYARIIKTMYLEDSPEESPLVTSAGGLVLTCALALPVLYLGIFFSQAIEVSEALSRLHVTR